MRWRCDPLAARRRGMSLIELLMALSISTMVAAAVAGMLSAVSTGVGTRRDIRAVMVRSHAAQSRLSSYLAPSRCVLHAQGDNLVLWLDDQRVSETVHATEIRWLGFNSDTGAIEVRYVSFPEEWSQVTCDLADQEFSADEDWMAVLDSYTSKDLIGVRPIVDQIVEATFALDDAQAQDAGRVTCQLVFDTERGMTMITTGAALRIHTPPVS